MTLIRIENGTHWHDLRSKHIGASEIAGLMGCSPWHTPLQLHLDKRDMVHHPISGQLADFGRTMEPIVAAYLADETGWKVEKSYQYAEHPDYPFLGCTIDYYVLESEHGRGILEIKYVNAFAPDWSQVKAPEHVEWQIQHQLLVVNGARIKKGLKPFAWSCIGSMHGGNPEDIRLIMRPPNYKMQSQIIERGGKFWADVQAGIEPEGELMEKDYAYTPEMFKQAHRLDETHVLDLTRSNDADILCEQYETLGEQIAGLTKERDKVKAYIMHKLLEIQPDKLQAHMLARSQKFEIGVELVEVNRKPRTARVDTSVRFKIKPIKEK